MNRIAPAYSVIATSLIILIGCTLVGYPSSVFSQSETANNAQLAENLVNESTAATSSDEVEAEDFVSVSKLVPVAEKPNYKLEKLLSDKVYSDFVVGPGRFSLEIAPGETKVVEMTVTNRMGIPKTFIFETEDMAGTDDPDVSIVLLGDEVGPYTIRDYIQVPEGRFRLEHAQRARIPVTVSLPPDAEPGGYYGSLLVSIISEEGEKDEGEVVPGTKIVSRIGTLFFITTPGDIVRSSEVKSFATVGDQKFFSKGPVEFNIVTENTGSVHVTPSGELRVFNTLGNEVGFTELLPWHVLPKSVRNKEISWEREFLVGRYTATIKIHRGYGDVIDELSYTFWVIPLELLAGVFAVFFVIFLLFRFLFSRFEFKRKG